MPNSSFNSSSAVLGIERVHLQRGGINQKARADKLVVLFVIAQHVANILAEKAFDAFAKFLHAVDVLLLHAPGAVFGVGRARLEFLDAFFDLVIPGNIGHQIAHRRKGSHRLDRDRLVHRQSVEPGHAHQFRHAVDLRRARAAFARFAVPAAGEIAGLFGLDLMHGIEHDHALGHLGRGNRQISLRRARRAKF